MNLISVTVSSLIWNILMNANTGNDMAFVDSDYSIQSVYTWDVVTVALAF